ncbi:MAG: hypothetical protein ACHRXM_04870 [Isosphaerales bacterium]
MFVQCLGGKAEAVLKMRFVKIGLALGWVLTVARGETARGDGGTVHLSRCEGGYRITVFTEPTPFRAGPVDISVFVQDATTGEPMNEVRVIVGLAPCDRPGETVRHAATTEAATNKLFQAAAFDLAEPGRWEVEVAVEGSRGSAQLRFELMAAPRAPRWLTMWPWVGWPVLVILLFSIHQWLVFARKKLSMRAR